VNGYKLVNSHKKFFSNYVLTILEGQVGQFFYNKKLEKEHNRLGCNLPHGNPKGCCDVNLARWRLSTTARRRDARDPSDNFL
jgi:hypothetical protein